MHGQLMTGDSVAAEIRGWELYPVREELLPLYFTQPDSTLRGWLALRALDTTRDNALLLLDARGLAGADACEIALAVNAAAVTDSFWVRREGEVLSRADVSAWDCSLAATALLGAPPEPAGGPMPRTPELTNTGSFEKCWRREKGMWWLYKAGDAGNLFSEMAAYRLCTLLGYPCARYEFVSREEDVLAARAGAGRGLVRTADFTRGGALTLEPGVSLGLRSSSPAHNYRELKRLSVQLAARYVELLTMDALVNNVDRHNQNFGVLRDMGTGDILGLAPNYDNNLSLLADKFPRRMDKDEPYLDWRGTVQGNLLNLTLPALDEGELWDVLSGVETDMRRATGCALEPGELEGAAGAILDAYRQMEVVCEQLHRFHNPGRRPILTE